MSSGWIPLHKALVKELPKDRPFSRLEAMFSITMDYDEGNMVSVCGYSKLWRWSEGRVRRFLEEIGTRIEYPVSTSSRQNQRGVIVIGNAEGSRSDGGGIKAIDSKWLSHQAKGKRSDNGVKAKGSQTPTKEPKPEPDPKPIETLSPDSLRLSSLLADLILKNNPSHSKLCNG